MPRDRAAVRWLLLLLLVAAPGCGRSFSGIAADKEARLRKLLEERGGRVVKFQTKVESEEARITLAYTDTSYEAPDGKKEDSISEEEFVYGLKKGKWAFVTSAHTGFGGRLVTGKVRHYITTEELWEIMTKMP